MVWKETPVGEEFALHADICNLSSGPSGLCPPRGWPLHPSPFPCIPLCCTGWGAGLCTHPTVTGLAPLASACLVAGHHSTVSGTTNTPPPSNDHRCASPKTRWE